MLMPISYAADLTPTDLPLPWRTTYINIRTTEAKQRQWQRKVLAKASHFATAFPTSTGTGLYGDGYISRNTN
jgi:hypothetical protein